MHVEQFSTYFIVPEVEVEVEVPSPLIRLCMLNACFRNALSENQITVAGISVFFFPDFILFLFERALERFARRYGYRLLTIKVSYI